MKIRLAIFIGFIIALLASIGLYKQNQKLSQEKSAIEKSLYDSLTVTKNEIATLVKVREVETEVFKQKVDSIAKLLDVKPKYIKGHDSYITKTEIDTLLVTKPVYVTQWKDSAYAFNYDDSWNKIAGKVGSKGAIIEFSSIDTLTRLTYSRTNIFGRTENLVYLRNGNPKVTFTKGYSYIHKEKRAWLTIGPAVYVDPFAGRIGVGISAQYPLIQLKR